MRKILVPLAGGAPIVLTKAVMFFGRGNECDIILTQSRKISRKHCCIAQIDDSYLIRDLGSMNGVRVNGKRAEPELPLNDDDELLIGDIGFRFQEGIQKTIKVTNAGKKKGIINKQLASTDVPIPIGEEDVDFKVEKTGGFPLIQSDEIRLSEDNSQSEE